MREKISPQKLGWALLDPVDELVDLGVFPKGLPGVKRLGQLPWLDGLVNLLMTDLVDQILVTSTL
jgi:hypothetical protein